MGSTCVQPGGILEDVKPRVLVETGLELNQQEVAGVALRNQGHVVTISRRGGDAAAQTVGFGVVAKSESLSQIVCEMDSQGPKADVCITHALSLLSVDAFAFQPFVDSSGAREGRIDWL